MSTQTTDKDDHGRNNAKGWVEIIAEWQEQADDDARKERMDELQSQIDEIEEWLFAYEGDKRRAPYTLKRDELTKLEAELKPLEDFDRDDLDQTIQESPLSVQIRSGWYSPGEKPEPYEFEILLTTGGPGLRILGELDEHNEPYRAWLQYQDWGTPWTQYFDVEPETLLWYARHFYYGQD